jgi:hypothetical protein
LNAASSVSPFIKGAPWQNDATPDFKKRALRAAAAARLAARLSRSSPHDGLRESGMMQRDPLGASWTEDRL